MLGSLFKTVHTPFIYNGGPFSTDGKAPVNQEQFTIATEHCQHPLFSQLSQPSTHIQPMGMEGLGRKTKLTNEKA